MTGGARRVAVTGIGLITPLGLKAPSTWLAAIEGTSGVGPITRFDATALSVRIAGEVKGFTPEPIISPKEARKMGLFTQYGVVAGIEALTDAGFKGLFGPDGTDPATKAVDPDRVGIHLSAGMGGLPEIQYWDRELLAKEKKTVSPFFIPMVIPNLSGGHLSIMVGAKGPNLCTATACASSAHAIGESAWLVRSGKADIMVAGGAEAVICELGIAGFASMKALSTRNDDPEHASRPYDKDRDGFVLGEGAGVLVLEEWDHAKRRGARIYGEFKGFGMNADAYHMTSPAPEGAGAEKCIRLCLEDARLNATEIGYVNAHGTSTPTGDGLEAQAIAKVFGSGKRSMGGTAAPSVVASNPSLHISSTKSMMGHLLGAAGGVEAALTVLSLYHGIIPPTINLDTLDEVCTTTGLDFTPKHAVKKNYRYGLSNSFGFGGTNASLIFAQI